LTHKDDHKAKAFEYKIKYLIGPDENPVVALLPEKMFVYYSKNHIYYYTEGWMGFFSSSQILNLQDSTRIVLAKFLDKKFAHKQRFSEMPLKFESVKPFSLADSAIKTSFNGFEAQQRDLMYNESQDKKHKIVFTSQFNIQNPNIGTPFSNINGVLLCFPMHTMGIPMEVELINTKDTLFNDSMFNVPKSYQLVDREKFEAVFEEYAPK
jgi:hypothetical protein